MHLTGLKFALAAATLALTPAAHADDTIESEARVAYGDLDLTTEEGVAELDRRIDEAARTICGVREVRTGSRLPSRSARKCYDEAKRQLDRQFAEIKRNAYLGG